MTMFLRVSLRTPVVRACETCPGCGPDRRGPRWPFAGRPDDDLEAVFSSLIHSGTQPNNTQGTAS